MLAPTRYCVFCGKELPAPGPPELRAPVCPHCGLPDTHRDSQPPGPEAQQSAAGREGAAEEGQAQHALSQTVGSGIPADVDPDVATLLPFRLAVQPQGDDVPGPPAPESASPQASTGEASAARPFADAPPCDAGAPEKPLAGDTSDAQYVTERMAPPFGVRLVLVEGKAAPREMKLEDGVHLLGGSRTCDLVVRASAGTISRRHASLRCMRGLGGEPIVFVEDLNSLNGTQVNGRRARVVTRLQPGDTVTFADITYRVVV